MLIQIREGKLAGCTLVGIRSLADAGHAQAEPGSLRGVSLGAGGTIRIGALTTFSHIAVDPVIHAHIPVLGQAADLVGGPQIRNIGTIGGNIANGVTSADTASTLLAWDALLEYTTATETGVVESRLVPMAAHYMGAGKTALAHEEILTAIMVPRSSWEHCFGHYIKYAMRNALDIATIGCSVNLRLGPDKKTVERLRIAYGVAGPIPLRAKSAEDAAKGQPVSRETIDAAARAALGDINPRSSWRAAREVRLHLAEELARRAFTASVELAGGVV